MPMTALLGPYLSPDAIVVVLAAAALVVFAAVGARRIGEHTGRPG